MKLPDRPYVFQVDRSDGDSLSSAVIRPMRNPMLMSRKDKTRKLRRKGIQGMRLIR